MTPRWKQTVRDRLDEMGKDHRWLEAQLGAGRGMVTRMLGDRQNTSALVDRVCSVLGISGPVAIPLSVAEDEVFDLLRRASDDQRAAVLAILALVKKP